MSPFEITREEAFRYTHEDATEHRIACHNSMEDESCSNSCRYLLSADLDGHLPSIVALDGGEAFILGWGGDDIENITIEAYCRDCVEARQRGHCTIKAPPPPHA